jgi:hypothetical protein
MDWCGASAIDVGLFHAGVSLCHVSSKAKQFSFFLSMNGFLIQIGAFHLSPTTPLRPNSLQMILNFGKKADSALSSKKGVEVTVDKKVITSAETPVNLRKLLMANGVDVYPLRAKITGNCGGAGE